MPMRLKSLVVDRVDLVDRGANPDAHVVLFKRDALATNVKKTTFTDLLNLQEFQEAIFEIMDMCLTLEDALYSSLYSDGDRAAEIRTSVKQFSDAVDAALTEWLNGDAVAKRDATSVVQNIQARLRHVIQEGLVNDTILKEEPVVETPPPVEPETPPVTELPVEPETPPTEPATEVDIIKSLPESLRKRLEFADHAEAAIAKSAQEARVAEERAELLTFEKRAEEEYSKYSGTATERARVLMAVRTLPESVQKTLTSMLAAGHSALAKAMDPIGSDAVAEGGVVDRVNRMAAERVTKKQSPTTEQAVDVVLREHPDWYAEYRAEKR